MTKRQRPTPTTFDDILRDHSPIVCVVVERLRALIMKVVPEATESANAGWHSLNFRHPHAGYFCGLFPRADDVLMVFEFGILLPDPEGVLEGDGRQVRFITLRRESDIRVRAITALLQAALVLPTEKSVRLELIRTRTKLI